MLRMNVNQLNVNRKIKVNFAEIKLQIEYINNDKLFYKIKYTTKIGTFRNNNLSHIHMIFFFSSIEIL